MGRYDHLLQQESQEHPGKESPSDGKGAGVTPRRHDATTSVRRDVKTGGRARVSESDADDGTVGVIADSDTDEWREVLQNTETHNTAFRLTAAERDSVEDLVLELRRRHRIKTSMNELARLGLLFLTTDFRRRGSASLIHRVKRLSPLR